MEKSSLMMIIIIVLLVLVLGTVVAVTFVGINAMQNFEAQASQAADPWDRHPRELSPTEISWVTIGEAIVTVLASESGGSNSGTARIQVVVGYDNTQDASSTQVSELITDQMEYIRRVALTSIRSRTYQELLARDGMESLSAEILDTIQNDLRTNMIVSVAFNEWVVM